MMKRARPVVVLATFLLIFRSSNSLTVTEMNDDLEVTISRGAHVTPIDNVLMYTDIEYLIFTIPDIPDPPNLSSLECAVNDVEACTLYTELQQGLKDVSGLMSVINRVLTTRGLKDVSPIDVQIPETWINVLKGVSVASNLPDPDVISEAGEDWFTDTEARLTLRKLLANSSQPLLRREKRWVKTVLRTGLQLAKVAFNGDVTGFFSKLFVGDNGILNFLTNYKVKTRKEFKMFAELPKRVSELETTTKDLLLDVLNSTAIVKKITQEIQEEIQDHAYKLSTIENAFLLEQNTLADIIRTIYATTAYSIHLASFEECRSSQIPLAFVPPQLLHSRLLEIQTALPQEVRFVIPVEEFQRYYRLPLSQCFYDSSGGIVKINVPLIVKSLDLHMYEFRALHFAHNEQTCAIETPSSFIIKDFNSNKIFSVTELDEEYCEPHKTGLCKVPFTTADDSNNFCVAVLLGGEPASVVKETCALNCFTDGRPSLSQVTDDVFIGVHLKPMNVRMECPDGIYEVNANVPQGSIRFQTVCGCHIYHGNKLLGKSSTKSCENRKQPKVDVLMPVQMTRFNDLLPFTSDGWENTVFSSATEIYNDNFQPGEVETYEDTTEIPFRVSTFSWNFLQSMVMTYLYFKLNAVSATLLAVSGNMPLAQAVRAHTCELPNDVQILLWAILVVCSLSLIPDLVCKIYRTIKNIYIEHVQLVARRYVHDDV